MRSLRPHLHFRTPMAAFSIMALALLGGCTEGRAPLDPSAEGVPAFLALNPQFQPSLTTVAAAEIVRIRVVATVFGTGELLGSTEIDVDPNASSWDIQVEVIVPPGIGAQVEFTVELLNAGLGTEWSGHVGPLTLTPGAETTIQNVTIVRGSLDNLSVTAVSISGAPAELLVGQSATLTGSAVSSASSANPQIFWASLDQAVASVTPSGTAATTVTVTGLTVGSARIVATAGPQADTVTILVKAPLGSVVIAPTQAAAESLGETLVFTAQVKDTYGNVVTGEAVTWTVGHASILTNLGGGSYRTLATGNTTVTATSVSSPTLSATATVSVTQVPNSVEVTPDEAELASLGDTEQFAAQAFDANDNLIPGTTFEWTSSDDEVATVDGTGLATAQGNGSATIQAEALSATATSGAQQNGGSPTGVKGTATLDVQQQPDAVLVTPEAARLTEEGAVQQFTAQAFDANEHAILDLGFTWTSSDDEVATVDGSGLATAVDEGTATIRAEAWMPGTSPSQGAPAIGTPEMGTPSGVYGEASLVVEFSQVPLPPDFFPLGVGYNWTYRAVDFFGGGAPNEATFTANGEGTVMDYITGMMAFGGFNWYMMCGNGFMSASWGEGCNLWRATPAGVYLSGSLGTQPIIPFLMAPLLVDNSWTFQYSVGEVTVTDYFAIVAFLQSLAIEGVTYHNVLHMSITEMFGETADLKMDIYFAPGVGIVRIDYSWSEGDGLWTLYQRMTLLSFLMSLPSDSPELLGASSPFALPGKPGANSGWSFLGAFGSKGAGGTPGGSSH
ncbi:Ig-like domain-containing protein [Gemmatimonadota bacterium]